MTTPPTPPRADDPQGREVLLPCPMCGCAMILGPRTDALDKHTQIRAVSCSGCGLRLTVASSLGRVAEIDAELRMRWNRRVAPEPVRETSPKFVVHPPAEGGLLATRPSWEAMHTPTGPADGGTWDDWRRRQEQAKRAQPEPQQQGGEFSLERIDGTKDSYKLYSGRHQPIGDGFMVGHGLWLCTISDFDANGEQTRERIVAALNAAPAPAAPAGVTEAMVEAALVAWTDPAGPQPSGPRMRAALAAALAAAGKG